MKPTVFATVLLFCLSCRCLWAIPSLSGPGGLITIPSAYVRTGGLVAPITTESGGSETSTSLNYAFSGTAELGLQDTSVNGTGVNVKYQFSQDKKDEATSAAMAIGFMDQKVEHTKSFYGVMSKNIQSASSVPFVLHLGIMSEGSIAGHIRPIAGFETVLSPQTRIVGEYNGSKNDINGGFVYQFTRNMGTFLYLMDVESSGLNSDLISGFTFNLAF